MHERPSPPQGVHHVAVQVTDLSEAERFYVDILGFQVRERWPARAGDAPGDRSVWIDSGSGSFVALERASPQAPRPARAPFTDPHAGWHLLAVRIAATDRSRWESWLAQQGVEIVHRTAWTLYVRDPDGNRIGLSHHPEFAQAMDQRINAVERSVTGDTAWERAG